MMKNHLVASINETVTEKVNKLLTQIIMGLK